MKLTKRMNEIEEELRELSYLSGGKETERTKSLTEEYQRLMKEQEKSDKQIEEMAKELCDATQKTNQRCNPICYPRGMCAHCKVMAEHLYTADYRKSSEVAGEIFNEIINLLLSFVYLGVDGQWHTTKKYASKLHSFVEGCMQLKEKYTEGGK